MKPFDPDRAPCWQEQVEHAKTWSDSPEVLRAERRYVIQRRLVAVSLVVALVALAGYGVWLAGGWS